MQYWSEQHVSALKMTRLLPERAISCKVLTSKHYKVCGRTSLPAHTAEARQTEDRKTFSFLNSGCFSPWQVKTLRKYTENKTQGLRCCKNMTFKWNSSHWTQMFMFITDVLKLYYWNELNCITESFSLSVNESVRWSNVFTAHSVGAFSSSVKLNIYVKLSRFLPLRQHNSQRRPNN